MLSPYQLVKEVAKLLEQDQMCYVDRATREVTKIDLSQKKSPEIKEQIILLEQKSAKYLKIVPMPRQTLVFTMQDFLQEVTDQEIKKELRNGLKRKHPMRNFMQIVESRYDINQHWNLFKSEQYAKYVGQLFINDYNY
ncbi:MAG: UPF0158 family protein [Saprospiraceae bacterium]